MPTNQQLGDLLSGFGGAPIDRPKLDAFVATSQARNGLVSQQTEEARLNAMRAQEEQEAAGQLENAFVAGGAPASEAHIMAIASRMHAGSAVNALDMLKAYSASKLGDPSQLNTPGQTAASQAINGKLEGPLQVPGNYYVPAGVNPPTVFQNPQAAAATSASNALAGLHGVQAAAGGWNPHAGGGPIDPQAVEFGAYSLYKTGKMPALGMGSSPLRGAILQGAAELSQREANGEDITNKGFDTAIANGQDYLGANRAISSFAGGPLGNQTRSINNAVGHLQLLETLWTALNNGDIQGVNKISSTFKKQFGYDAPTNIDAAAHVLGPELTKILSNTNAGTGEERMEFTHLVGNLAYAPEQATGAINTLKQMMGRQATDLALQYHGATGRSDFAARYMAPDVSQYLEITPNAGGAAPPAGGTPAPATGTPPPTGSQMPPPEAVAKLSEGIHTTFGNGQIWTLQSGKPVRVQ